MRNFFNAAFKNPVSISVISLFATLFIWWAWLHYFINASSTSLNLWADIYQLIALFGAIFGLIISGRWGGTKTFIGRAIIAFSIGLLFQCFGQSAYIYYIRYLSIDIPYPSVGDIGFFLSILLFIYGVLLLVKVSHTKLSLRLFSSNIHTIIIPLVILAVSYFIFLQDYSLNWSNLIKIFSDFGFPLLDIIPVSIALLAFSLSQQKLGGALKLPLIFFILALFSLYLSDFVFIYEANHGTYYGGGINDLMYAVSYLLMTISLILLSIWPKILPNN